MEWYIFACISAILATSATLIEKNILNKDHSHDFIWLFSFLNFIMLSPLILKIDFNIISFYTILIIFIASIFGSAGFYFVTKAIKYSDISLISPLLILSPAVNTLFAFIFLKEILSLTQLTGMLILIIGIYILETRKHNHFFDPFKKLIRDKYANYALFALMFYGFSSVLDKTIVSKLNISTPIYLLFIHFFIFINYSIIFCLEFSSKELLNTAKKFKPTLILISIFTIGYRGAQIKALELGGSVGLVSTIKRTSAILTALIGGKMFHETNLKHKLIASLTMFIGIYLIIIK